jgi:hypothetical protein
MLRSVQRIRAGNHAYLKTCWPGEPARSESHVAALLLCYILTPPPDAPRQLCLQQLESRRGSIGASDKRIATA